MATAAKPKAAAKPDAPQEQAAPPAKKSKKVLIIIVIAAVLLIGGGTTAYFLMKSSHAPTTNDSADETANEATDETVKQNKEKKTHSDVPPKYAMLGTFTANLIHEEGDRYLQVAISLKLSKPELEEKIKASNPEILHHVNMVLQSKRPSELATLEGKDKLASDIRVQIERILGLAKAAPLNSSTQPESAPAATSQQSKSGIDEVLFTSFIIQ